MGGCYSGGKKGQRQKQTPTIHLEGVSEHSATSRIYKEVVRDPEGLFIQRENKKCFLRNNGLLILEQQQKLAVLESLKYM
jgi:hypothetical protein